MHSLVRDMSDNFAALKESLNQEQLLAVETISGPVLVLAGAGTGKTKVLTHRVANLIHKGIYPSEILVVTFTNKAAKEMKERIGLLLNKIEMPYLGTFHSIAVKILRKHGDLLGLQSNFTIIDSDDQIRVLKTLLKEYNIDEKKHPAKELANIINRWKDAALTPDKVKPHENASFAAGNALTLYKEYQKRLLSLNAVDFGDLVLFNLNLFLNYPNVLNEYQQRLKYILVDEYQDTNIAQYLWLRILAQKNQNICCVGDDDQSIYSWRGAQVANILKFEKDFVGAKVIKLERNYRSTSQILSAASKLIAHNKGRLGKVLWTEKNEGTPIKLWSFWDDLEEANAVSDEIESLILNKNVGLEQIAILVRASYQTRFFEENLVSRAIPYRVVGGLRFYERQEIKDIIAYLRLIEQPYDLLAFERIANTPRRGLGAVGLAQIINTARSYNLTIIEAISKLIKEDHLHGKAKIAMEIFCKQLIVWDEQKNIISLSELTNLVLKDSGYLLMWQNDKNIESEGRVDNIKELVNALEEFSNLQEFLEHVSLVMDSDKNHNEPMVNIMTLHAAKGLEFDAVFLPGWEHGIFPHQRAIDDAEGGIEEERRLAYVGITRAKKYAYISFASRRRIYGRYQQSIPSNFIRELPEDCLSHNFNLNKQQDNEYNEDYSEYTKPNYKKSYNTNYEDYKAPLQTAQKEKTTDNSVIGIGSRIFHIKFGYGRVISLDGKKLEIEFDKAGRKTVMSEFVQLAGMAS